MRWKNSASGIVGPPAAGADAGTRGSGRRAAGDVLIGKFSSLGRHRRRTADKSMRLGEEPYRKADLECGEDLRFPFLHLARPRPRKMKKSKAASLAALQMALPSAARMVVSRSTNGPALTFLPRARHAQPPSHLDPHLRGRPPPRFPAGRRP